MSTTEFIHNKFDFLLDKISGSGALNNDLNLYCLVDKLMLAVIHAGR